jgi:hypothetical protein
VQSRCKFRGSGFAHLLISTMSRSSSVAELASNWIAVILSSSTVNPNTTGRPDKTRLPIDPGQPRGPGSSSKRLCDSL